MNASSGPGRPTEVWRAVYYFRGQPGLPGMPGRSDVHGSTSADSFERLAAHLIADAGRRWWDIEVPVQVRNFGEILLRHGRPIAEAQGRWTYKPNGRQDWAHVMVTYDPDGR